MKQTPMIQVKHTLLFLLVGILLAQPAVAQSTKFIRIKGRFDRAWAMDEKSGRIFATNNNPDDDGGIEEFDPKTGDQVDLHEAVSNGNCLAIKNGKLLIGYQKSRGRYYAAIFDLDSNKISQKQLVYSSRPMNFLTNDSTKWIHILSDGSRIRQLDLTPNSSGRTYYIRNGRLVRGCLSVDGKSILGGGPTSTWEPKLFKPYYFTPDKRHYEFRANDTKVAATKANAISALYSRNCWAIGNEVWNNELTEKVKEFPGDIVVDHPTHDLVVSYDRQFIYLSQFSTSKLLEKIKIAEEKPKRSWTKQPIINFSLKNSSLFIGDEKNAYVVPIGKFLERAGIRVNLIVPTSVRAGFSDPFEIKLATASDGSISKEIKLKLEKAPTGAKIHDGKVVWSPSKKDVGKYEFVIAASKGSKTDRVSIAVEIISAPLKLGLIKKQWALSDDNRHAILVGSELPKEGQRYSYNSNLNYVQIVDLKEQKTVAVKKLSDNIRQFFVVGDYIFVNVSRNQYFYRYSMKDLDADPQRILLPGYVGSLTREPDGKLLAKIGDSHYQGTHQVLDYETFKMVKNDSRNKTPDRRNRIYMKAKFAFEKGRWSDGNLLYDRNGKVLLPIKSVFQSLRHNNSKAKSRNRNYTSSSSYHPRMQETPRAMPSHHSTPASIDIFWSRILRRNLYDTRGSQILGFDSYAAVHPDFPMVLRIRPVSVRLGGGRTSTYTLFLEGYDLIDGKKILQETVFEQESQRSPSPYHSGVTNRNAPFYIVGKDVVIYESNHLYFAKITDKSIEKTKMPLMLEFPKEFTIDLAKKSEFKIPCNRSEDLTFDLDQIYEGVTVDDNRGVLKIDGPTLLKNSIKFSGNRRSDSDVELSKKLGVPSGRIPFSMPLTIRVNDSEGQFDSLRYSLVATIDEATYSRMLEERKKEIMEAEKLRMKQRLEKLEVELLILSKDAEEAKKEAGKGDVTKRIENLETRFKALRARMRYYGEQIKLRMSTEAPIRDRIRPSGGGKMEKGGSRKGDVKKR